MHTSTLISCFYLQFWLAFAALLLLHPPALNADYPLDMVAMLPDQPPEAASLRQYSGYVTVDESAGRAFFYYFVEATEGNPASMPLTLWLNGGPGCSSLGFGSFAEIGPFRPSKNGLILNQYAWSKATNLLFVESPAGVGFSYSNTTQDYQNQNDNNTAKDNFSFLLKWFEKFPEYKGRAFYIAGESYAGHYIPELSALVQGYMSSFGSSTFNLKAIAIGNPLLDFVKDSMASELYLWSHGVNSDETYEAVSSSCDWQTFLQNAENHTLSTSCVAALNNSFHEIGPFEDLYDVTANVCLRSSNNLQAITLTNMMKKMGGLPDQERFGSDPCIQSEVAVYLNRPDVQAALHANTTKLQYPWSLCTNVSHYDHSELMLKMIPVLEGLVGRGIRVLIYSGDQDSVIPLIGTRNMINELARKLRWNTTTTYRAWYHNSQVAGWTQAYGSELTYATVRGAGHAVPLTQPPQSLTLFQAFLGGSPLPTAPPK